MDQLLYYFYYFASIPILLDFECVFLLAIEVYEFIAAAATAATVLFFDEGVSSLLTLRLEKFADGEWMLLPRERYPVPRVGICRVAKLEGLFTDLLFAITLSLRTFNVTT